MLIEKILKPVNKTTDIVCITFMGIAFLITICQVAGRYILRMPIYFAEELARYLFIWICMLGASIVNRNDEHTAILFIVTKLPHKIGNLFYVIREIIIIFILVCMTYYGIIL